MHFHANIHHNQTTSKTSEKTSNLTTREAMTSNQTLDYQKAPLWTCSREAKNSRFWVVGFWYKVYLLFSPMTKPP
jgi:hypothetical protein